MPGIQPEANHIFRQDENTVDWSAGPGGERQKMQQKSPSELPQTSSVWSRAFGQTTDRQSSKDFLQQASRSQRYYHEGNHPHPLWVHMVQEELTPFPSSRTDIANQYTLHPGILAAATISQVGT